MSDPLWSASAAFVDYDRDGDLDLFVANYLDFTVAGNKRCNDALGARDYCSPRTYRPVPDRALPQRRWRPIQRRQRRPPASPRPTAPGLGVSVGDYNGDGWPDLYVANDATPNQLWINQTQRDVRGRRPAVGLGIERRGQSRRQHGHRLRRLRRRRRRGPLRHEHRRRDVRRSTATTAAAASTTCAPGSDSRRRPRHLPALAPTGSTTTTTAGSTSSSLTAPSTSIEAQRGEKFPFRMRNQLFRNTGARALRGDEQGRGTGVRSRGDRPRRGLWRHRQRRRCRRRRHEQQRAGEAAPQPGGYAGTTGCNLRLQQAPGNRFAFGAWIRCRAGR